MNLAVDCGRAAHDPSGQVRLNEGVILEEETRERMLS